MTALEAQLLLARALVLALLYCFLGVVAWLAWRDLRAARRGSVRGGEPAAARLIVLDGAASDRPPGASFRLEAVTTIGRDLDNAVVFADPTVSGRHAVLHVREGAWWLEDLSSTNGTFVNGERLMREAPAIVRSGDVLQVGVVRLRLVTPEL